MDETEALLTIEEVATRFKVTTKTVRQWLQRGQLKGIKVGKLWRVPTAELQDFIQRSTPSREA